MLDYIRGILAHASLEKVTIEMQGLGYLFFVPLASCAKLPSLGSLVTLFVSTVIREDSHRQYGFLSREERDCFELLIEISGVGPKIALALLGHMEVGNLRSAISQGRTDLISKIPGIGKKTSERLVVELRDKMKPSLCLQSPSGAAEGSGVVSDAIGALIHLGYPLGQAQRAIQAVLPEGESLADLPSLITAALRNLQSTSSGSAR